MGAPRMKSARLPVRSRLAVSSELRRRRPRSHPLVITLQMIPLLETHTSHPCRLAPASCFVKVSFTG